MIRYAGMGVALLATVGGGTASAQAVVEDPGYCAQYYPGANCNNYGPGNPLYPGSYRPSVSYGAYRGSYAPTPPVVVRRHKRQPARN